MIAFAVLLLAMAIGIVWMEVLGPADGGPWRRVFQVACGIPLGLGSTALLFLAAPGAHLVLDVALLATGAYVAWRKVPIGQRGFPAHSFAYNWLLALAAAGSLALVFAAVYPAAASVPHGDWDAWAIWNLRAKFLAGPVELWPNAVSPQLSVSHPDYPLLLSAIHARAWRMAGSTSPAVPFSVALIFFACAAGILASSLALIRRSNAAASLGLLVFAASAGYALQAPSQYADIPLSVYIVAALACAMLDLPIAGGLLAACAANTKNEGIVFGLAYVVAMLVSTRRPTILYGALPGFLMLGLFKAFYAPASEYAGRTPDFSRLGVILEALVDSVRDLGLGAANPLLLLAVLALGLRFAKPAAPAWLACIGVFAALAVSYLSAYLMTPADVKWQLGTSLSRVIAQVWPAVLFLVLLRLNTLEELFPVVIAAKRK